MTAAVGSGSLYKYRLVLIIFSGVQVAFTTIFANSAIYSTSNATVAAGAGFILLAAILMAWVFALGMENNPLLHTKRNSSRSTPRMMMAQSATGAILPTVRPGTPGTGRKASMSPSGRHSMSSSREGGLGGVPVTSATSTPPSGSSSQPVTVVVGQRTVTNDSGRMDVSDDAQYVYKGQALYAYTASPDDPNELSFEKGELLDIVDNKGKWWQARKKDGNIGIVPSNYIRIV